jgi:uncharacterized protein involved in exopolysaccharide biosynthesis
MTEQNAPPDDEINLAELAASLISNWRIILTAGLAVAVLTAGYAKVFVTPTYEAKSIFAFEKGRPNAGLGGLGGAVAALGLSIGKDKEDKLVFDRVKGRDFIIELAETTGLYEDPYFNPRLASPEFSLFGAMFGVEPKTSWSDGEVDRSIVSRYEKSVRLSTTKNDSLEATVLHTNPDAAAKIANAVVKKILKDTLDDQKSNTVQELSYLETQLAKAQTEMTASVMRVQDFSISNNPPSVEELARKTSEVVKLKASGAAVNRLIEGTTALIAASADPGQKVVIFKAFPELLKEEFRQQGQLSAEETNVSDLPKERLEQIAQRLAEHAVVIAATTASAEAETKLAAKAASKLMTLQRDVQLQQATYDLLVDEYKARAVGSGFEEANGLILQVAVAPLERSAPKVALLTGAGAAVGILIGAIIAMTRSAMSGSLHTGRAIIAATRPKKVFSMKKTVTAAEVAVHALDSSKYALLWSVSPTAGSLSDTASNHFMKAWSDAGLRAAVINLPSGRTTFADPAQAGTQADLGDLASLLLKGNAIETIEAKTAKLDRVLLKCDYDKVPSAFLSLMTELPMSLIAVARLGNARKAAAESIREAAHPDVLLLG